MFILGRRMSFFFNRVAEDYKKCSEYGKYSELVCKISDRLQKYDFQHDRKENIVNQGEGKENEGKEDTAQKRKKRWGDL